MGNHPVIQIIIFLFFLGPWILAMTATYLRMGKKFFHSICIGTILWLTVLFAGTELLSLFHEITRRTLAIFWVFVISVEFIWLLFGRRKERQEKVGATLIGKSIEKIIKGDKLLLACICGIAILLTRNLIVALTTVPYNWDSMTYHLARIMFWIEHRSVEYYETNIIRQLVSPVLAEYINLHVILLTGGDICVNLLQCISGIGCVILTFGLLRDAGCGGRAACCGCLLLLTMNIVAAESVSTQNDLTASFFLFMIITLLLEIIHKKKIQFSLQNTYLFAILGLGCGLLYITKGNAAIPAAIVVAYTVIIRLIKKDRIKDLLLLGLISILGAFLIAGPTFWRNYRDFGDVLASSYVSGISIGTVHPGYILVNIIKNLGSIGVDRFNAGIIAKLVYGAGKILGIDVNAPTISFGDYRYGAAYSTTMDSAGASVFLPILLGGLAIGIYYIVKHRTIIELTQFVLQIQFFASLAIIRWQPWVVRLLLPSLILAVIPTSYFWKKALVRLLKTKTARRRIILIFQKGLSLLVVAFSLLCVYDSTLSMGKMAWRNLSHRQSRWELYFAGRNIGEKYEAVCNEIDRNAYKRIGLFSGEDSYQYPVLARYYQSMQIENISMSQDNKGSKVAMNEKFLPDVIFVMDHTLDNDSIYVCNDSEYRCVCNQGEYSLWEKIPG